MGTLKLTRRTVYLNTNEQDLYAGQPLSPITLPEALPPQPVAVQDMWFEQPLGRDWIVAYRLTLQNDNVHVVVGELRVFPAAPLRAPHSKDVEPPPGGWIGEVLGGKASVPAGGLKARLLRRIRLRAFERELSAIVKATKLPWRRPAPPIRDGAKKRGRKPKLRRYARVAVTYARAYEAGSAHPTRDVARQLRLTPATARAAVATARRLGFLTATPRGERGGRATPLAFDGLRSDDRRKP